MEQQKIWSHFQNHRLEVFKQAESRYRFLARQTIVGRVLNIGVGSGGFERWVAEMGCEVHSLDPDAEALTKISSISKGAAGSIDALPFANAFFDTVVCSEVLEHLDDDLLRDGLREIARVLKPDGVLIGTVPADEILSELETVCPCCGAVFHRWGHAQSFSQSKLANLLQSIGAVYIERRFFVHWSSLNWKGKCAAMLRLAMQAFGIYGSGHNFYFRVRKPA
jgi:2-polyprenyl-3-methyl-5-hydroxy-6-metoxy-1,4-benzoquinol methylase